MQSNRLISFFYISLSPCVEKSLSPSGPTSPSGAASHDIVPHPGSQPRQRHAHSAGYPISHAPAESRSAGCGARRKAVRLSGRRHGVAPWASVKLPLRPAFRSRQAYPSKARQAQAFLQAYPSKVRQAQVFLRACPSKEAQARRRAVGERQAPPAAGVPVEGAGVPVVVDVVVEGAAGTGVPAGVPVEGGAGTGVPGGVTAEPAAEEPVEGAGVPVVVDVVVEGATGTGVPAGVPVEGGAGTGVPGGVTAEPAAEEPVEGAGAPGVPPPVGEPPCCALAPCFFLSRCTKLTA